MITEAWCTALLWALYGGLFAEGCKIVAVGNQDNYVIPESWKKLSYWLIRFISVLLGVLLVWAHIDAFDNTVSKSIAFNIGFTGPLIGHKGIEATKRVEPSSSVEPD